MIKILKVLLVSLFAVSCFAQQVEFESLEQKLVEESLTAQELNKNLQFIEEYRITQRVCELQLSKTKVPVSCYQWLLNAERHGVITTIDRASLDKKCEHIAKKTSETGDLDTQLLPLKCAELAKETVALNKYKAGTEID